MKWSPEQDAALRAVDEWLKSDQQVFRLFGYAGTGKTTLAKHFAEGVDGTVLFGAFTGKAAHVLRQKGCEGATTIHSMIYESRQKGQARVKELEQALAEELMEIRASEPDDYDVDSDRRVMDLRRKLKEERNALARPLFTLNRNSDVKDASLVVLDEISMVDGQIGMDIQSFGTKLLVLGDPAQLPPVAGGGFFTENTEPDFMLTEIHRQAADNPIIAMATKVRRQEDLPLGEYGRSRVTAERLSPEVVLDADQVLVGRNRTRRASNARVRSLRELREDQPVAGDRLVCLKNNHELGLLNGAIWFVREVYGVENDKISMEIAAEDTGNVQGVTSWMHYFQGREEDLGWYEKREAQELTYGYALTVHKAQGSQWDDVVLFDESSCFRKDAWRWLYTGLTRAAERITVVRN